MARNLQEHILNTASELFYTQGIKATGIDAIIKATGIAKMSLYKYYPSKDALVLAHLQRSKEQISQLLLNGIQAKAGGPKQKLLAVFEVFAEMLACPGFRGCPFINAAAEFAETNNPVQQASANFNRDFCELLTDLAAQAGAAKPEELASQLAMLISGAIVTEQLQRQSGAMQLAYTAAEILIEKSLLKGE